MVQAVQVSNIKMPITLQAQNSISFEFLQNFMIFFFGFYTNVILFRDGYLAIIFTLQLYLLVMEIFH